MRGFVPELYRHLAACDLAIVQGGLTTCMELTATRRPFLYVPLRHHFEQNFHVRHRLNQYGAGRMVDFDLGHPGGDRKHDHARNRAACRLQTGRTRRRNTRRNPHRRTALGLSKRPVHDVEANEPPVGMPECFGDCGEDPESERLP